MSVDPFLLDRAFCGALPEPDSHCIEGKSAEVFDYEATQDVMSWRADPDRAALDALALDCFDGDDS